MLNILFIGDVMGRIGRETVQKILPKLKKELKVDLVIANAENSAHGTGITKQSLDELMSAGVDYFTSGDHIFDKEKQAYECFDEAYPVIRPANYSQSAPGPEFLIITTKDKKHRILLVNLIGRVFMKQDFDCPFHKIDEILANKSLHAEKYSAIIIDIHAEATSEKVTMGHYLDGRATAVVGTHTHVQTNDARITEKGMAYITDVGMVGAANECIGIEKKGIIRNFLTQIKTHNVMPEKGETIFNAVLVKINPKTAQAKSIKNITRFINI